MLRPRRAAPLFAIAGLGVLVGACALVGGCRTATDVTIVVTTDVPCADLRSTTVTVGEIIAIETRPITAATTTCSANGYVGTIVVIPSGSKTAEVAIKVVGGVARLAESCLAPDYGPGCIVARRALRYTPHTELRVPIALRLDCNGIPCHATETCDHGLCKPLSPDVPIDDDAGVPINDAGADADGDAGTTPTTTFGRLGLGETHSCAVMSDATVKCWGNNDYQQLGVTDAPLHLQPVAVPGATNATNVSASQGNACVRTTDGAVSCWGAAYQGLLGRTPVDNTDPTPTAVPNVANASHVALKVLGACARIADGRVQCWGSNMASEIGIGTTEANGHPSATFVPGITNAIDVSIGDGTACAHLRDGTVWCWGTATGQFGPTPAAFPGLSNVKQIASGRSHLCALLDDSTVSCLGSNAYGQLGAAPDGAIHGVAPVGGLRGVVFIASGAETTCAIMSDRTVKCWGADWMGAGHGTPTAVPGLTEIEDIGLGFGTHACARKTDGTVLCWGNNDHGQLGDGTKNGRGTVAPVLF